MDRSALRAGRTYGLIGGGISLVMAAFGISGLASRSVGLLSGLVGFLSLVLAFFYLLIYAEAGRVAAMQTGKVSTGALAGLVVCVVATLIALPGVLVLYVVAPNMIPFLIPIASFGRMPAGVVLVIEEVIEVGLSLPLCALLGALGGLAGSRAYRPVA